MQEFEPDQLKITTKFIQNSILNKGWVSPQNLQAQVELRNLFGTPAINHRITGTIYLTPQALPFNAYPDIIFNDPLRDLSKPSKTFSETLSDIQTNNNGLATFNLDLGRYLQSTYQLTLLSRGFVSNGGRGVSQTSSILVSPLKYLVGYKTENNLEYLRKNTKSTVHFIAINSELKKIQLKNLKIKLIQLNNILTLTEQNNGNYQYQSVLQEHTITNMDFLYPLQKVR